MSKQSGPIVFTATPEMAKSMKVFKAGAVYVAQRAAAVAISSNGSTATATQRAPRKASKKKKKTKKVTKKASKKKKVSKRVTKKTSKKVAKKTSKKASKGSLVKPEMIVKYVRQNAGCNMTDIEGHTRLPQATIRRFLNAAREQGHIRTEGQRRGLRYFVGAPTAALAV